MLDDKMLEKMLEKKVWAVVGVNENTEKYGNMIYKKLKRYGYKVYPVNPKYQEIEGKSATAICHCFRKTRCCKHGCFS